MVAPEPCPLWHPASIGRTRSYYALTGAVEAGLVRTAEDALTVPSQASAPLGPGAQSAGGVTVKVPAATPLRDDYYLLACADGAKVVKETDEADNCRASATKVTVIP